METGRMARGEAFAGSTSLVVEVCCSCGVMFAMPVDLKTYALNHRGPNGRWFYCPNGHDQFYTGETEEEKLKRALDQERTRSGRLAAERDQLEARRRSQKAANTRLRKRLANGVCPCCKRSFEDLHEHMKAKHPDYVVEDATE